MSAYAGYGFDVRNISEENLFRFFMKYDSADRIEEMITETLGVSKNPEHLTEDDRNPVCKPRPSLLAREITRPAEHKFKACGTAARFFLSEDRDNFYL